MSGVNRTVHLKGIPASSGIKIGTAWILDEKKVVVRPEKIEESEVEEHLEKFDRAIDILVSEYSSVKSEADEEVSNIIEAQIQTLKDPELHNLITGKIKEHHYGAVYAIFSTFNEYIQLMEASGASWLEERTIDIVTIRDQLIEIAKEKRTQVQAEEGAVVFANEISPTVMIELSRANIAGIVMQKGGLTSHAVILSQSLGIPCVVGVKWKHLNIPVRTTIAIDGGKGEVVILPSQSEIDDFKKRSDLLTSRLSHILEFAQKPHETKCGNPFSLKANVEFLEELPRIKTHGAKGVGLLRTETILFEKTDFDVLEQVEFYSAVMDAAGSETVTIRLFDAGGDKLLMNTEEEANPFLGWRGIRLLLDKKELLKNQLEAILRTSSKYPGRVRILIPMITNINEIVLVKQYVDEIKSSLTKEGLPIDKKISIGIMVEVPAIALMAEQVAKHVDFFSIGTNDLTQYTLAVDRGNEKISNLFNSSHPAIWKLIQMTKEGADKAGIEVAVCGEMASKPAAAACLLGIGISDLSMTTNALPGVKSLLCNTSLVKMKHLSKLVLDADTPEKVDTLLNQFAFENEMK
jgi:phosphoenolpyruvate-protein phosphotransferase (PTS system enzyme I)